MFGAEVGSERVEFFGVFARDDKFPGVETVFKAVLTGNGLSCFGAGSR
jgi:hypothetical protein